MEDVFPNPIFVTFISSPRDPNLIFPLVKKQANPSSHFTHSYCMTVMCWNEEAAGKLISGQNKQLCCKLLIVGNIIIVKCKTYYAWNISAQLTCKQVALFKCETLHKIEMVHLLLKTSCLVRNNSSSKGKESQDNQRDS